VWHAWTLNRLESGDGLNSSTSAETESVRFRAAGTDSKVIRGSIGAVHQSSGIEAYLKWWKIFGLIGEAHGSTANRPTSVRSMTV
jgi:hypothetical protein